MKLIIFHLIMFLVIMLSIAFYTLLERKIMSVNQLRLGPNKIFLGGVIQPVIDGFKLFLKEMNNPIVSQLLFFICPMISFFIMFLLWGMINLISLKFKMFLLLLILGLSVYPLILSGWSSLNKFSLLGSIRASSQIISYEILIFLLLISTIMFSYNFNFSEKKEFLFLFMAPMFILWIVVILAETNRAPFDFSEGESELISGFNTEYGGSNFAVFFLAEYGVMIFFSFFLSKLLFFNFLIFIIILYLLILTRTSFPRFRYDFLISLMWFYLLPFICIYLFILNSF